MIIRYMKKNSMNVLIKRLLWYKYHLKDGEEVKIPMYVLNHVATDAERKIVKGKMLTEPMLRKFLERIVRKLDIKSLIFITKPSWSGSNVLFTYSGNSNSVNLGNVLLNYDSSKMTLSGVVSGVNAGDYIFNLTPRTGYAWTDGTTTAQSYTWTINKKAITIPSVKTNRTYNGYSQSPEFNNYNSGLMTVSGNSATNAGSFTAIFVLKNTNNYKWSDGSISNKNVGWSIARAVISQPSVSANRTYNGSAQSPGWSGYNSGTMTMGGTNSATNSGTYTVTFTPKSNWCWSGGGIGAINRTWTISKLKLTIPSINANRTYNGAAQSPGISNFNGTWETVSGNSATNAGTYTATFKLKNTSNTTWSDGSTSNKTARWSIGKITVFSGDTVLYHMNTKNNGDGIYAQLKGRNAYTDNNMYGGTNSYFLASKINYTVSGHISNISTTVPGYPYVWCLANNVRSTSIDKTYSFSNVNESISFRFIRKA